MNTHVAPSQAMKPFGKALKSGDAASASSEASPMPALLKRPMSTASSPTPASPRAGAVAGGGGGISRSSSSKVDSALSSPTNQRGRKPGGVASGGKDGAGTAAAGGIAPVGSYASKLGSRRGSMVIGMGAGSITADADTTAADVPAAAAALVPAAAAAHVPAAAAAHVPAAASAAAAGLAEGGLDAAAAARKGLVQALSDVMSTTGGFYAVDSAVDLAVDSAVATAVGAVNRNMSGRLTLTKDPEFLGFKVADHAAAACGVGGEQE